MESRCRYVISAVGKGGETYYTSCDNKQELKEWIADNQEQLVMDELKIIDKNKNPLLKWLSFKK
ncbi:hypothetical protein [Sporosarcina sp. NPDC096371]|uniref:hypothetical protein n=1 Tax=Sporosarcina sp. NPDC096371 TaxID=3364530 RepID=UPI0037F1CAB7